MLWGNLKNSGKLKWKWIPGRWVECSKFSNYDHVPLPWLLLTGSFEATSLQNYPATIPKGTGSVTFSVDWVNTWWLLRADSKYGKWWISLCFWVSLKILSYKHSLYKLLLLGSFLTRRSWPVLPGSFRFTPSDLSCHTVAHVPDQRCEKPLMG